MEEILKGMTNTRRVKSEPLTMEKLKELVQTHGHLGLQISRIKHVDTIMIKRSDLGVLPTKINLPVHGLEEIKWLAQELEKIAKQIEADQNPKFFKHDCV